MSTGNTSSSIVTMNRFWEDIHLGQAVTAVTLDVTYQRVILNTASGRDYMRGHHEPEFARSQGVRGVYVNTFFHLAFVDRALTDWAGPRSFITRRKISMRAPIVAGDSIEAQGQVTGLREDHQGRGLVDLEITVHNQIEVCCFAEASLRLPRRAAPT